MGMLGAPVDLQLGGHLATQAVLGEHAGDGVADDVVSSIDQEVAVAGGGQPAGVAAVAVSHLAFGLARGHDDLVHVDNDDVVAHVGIGGERRLVLATQHRGHLGGQTAEHQAIGVDDVPGAGDIGWLGRERTHVPCSVRLGVEAPAGAGPVAVDPDCLRAGFLLRTADLGPTRRLPRIGRIGLVGKPRSGAAGSSELGRIRGGHPTAPPRWSLPPVSSTVAPATATAVAPATAFPIATEDFTEHAPSQQPEEATGPHRRPAPCPSRRGSGSGPPAWSGARLQPAP